MEDFLRQNTSAVFALIGAFGGSLISYIGSFLLKKRELNLRLWEKLIDRRIEAHDNVIVIALEMRVMVALGGFDNDGELRRAPQVLISKDEFDRWFTRFTQLTLRGTTWLTTDAKRELNFVQDYLVNLHHNLSSVHSERFLLVGDVIRQDFIDLSSSLEKSAFGYFENGMNTLKLDSLDKRHKYERIVTDARLGKTKLMCNLDQIRIIATNNTQHAM